MFFSKESLMPDEIDNYVVEFSSLPTMPNEHAFSYNLTYLEGAETKQWQRVWYISDANVKLIEIEIAQDALTSLQQARKRELHQFKADIERFLQASDKKLIVQEQQLILVNKSED